MARIGWVQGEEIPFRYGATAFSAVLHFEYEAVWVVGAEADDDAVFFFGESEEWVWEGFIGRALAGEGLWEGVRC